MPISPCQWLTFLPPSRPREQVKFLDHKQPSNLPDKSIVNVLITIPPNGASPPHTHHGAAVTALMHKGVARNQMNDDPPFLSRPGEAFFESPGCHHILSENASEDPNEEAVFFASLVLDTKIIEEEGYEALVVVDAEVEEQRKQGKH